MKKKIILLVNVLVVGSGGREHALGWKLSQSPHVDRVFYAPGNGGTENNLQISVNQTQSLIDFASKNDCFTVVGPEAPLAEGIVDEFEKNNLKIFGPTKDAAKLESSKIWAKNFMKRNNIPTAQFKIFEDPQKAIEYAKSVSFPLVVKADGLAAGKGVIVCNDTKEIISAIDMILTKKTFGSAGSKIILEERIDGIEASFIALSDGTAAIPLATSQDHKRAFDGDKGPNTGGMGAYSPTGAIDENMEDIIQESIINKTINSMRAEGIPFKGFLYAGIMIKDDAPYVLEYNVRMGDPECQPIMMRLNSDLYQYLVASQNGSLGELPEISWKNQSAVCVVLASKGYPGSYQTNDKITNSDLHNHDFFIFHAGTKKDGNSVVSNGGRVMGVTTLGDTLEQAISKAYSIVDKIHWPNKYYRSDIGKKGLSFL